MYGDIIGHNQNGPKPPGEVPYHNNDFEVFIDVSGTTEYYKEFEMNARAAWWDLALKAPYENGGYENSSRKGAQACCWDDPKARVVRRCVSLPAALPPFPSSFPSPSLAVVLLAMTNN